ncbi:hypothetical protein UlMin_005181 [Ulmus minor]
MARGGASRGGNNGGNRGKSNEVHTENQFSELESSDRSYTDNSNNPFFLNNGDHLGLSLVLNHLTGSNYNSWSRAMTMALIAKNNMCFVNGSISRPAIDEPSHNLWSRCNNMVMSWILNSLCKEIAESVMYIDNAVAMWLNLRDQFSQGNGPRIFQLKQQIHALTQGSNDVTNYFTKIKILWDELREFRPIPSCSCGGLKDLSDYHHQDYILQFLMGLNESFSQIAQILMSDPLPPINKGFSLVIQEERQRSVRCVSSTMSPISAAYGVTNCKYNTYKGKKDKPLCTFCGFHGHTIDKCYKKHGYPPVFKPKEYNNGLQGTIQ